MSRSPSRTVARTVTRELFSRIPSSRYLRYFSILEDGCNSSAIKVFTVLPLSSAFTVYCMASSVGIGFRNFFCGFRNYILLYHFCSHFTREEAGKNGKIL